MTIPDSFKRSAYVVLGSMDCFRIHWTEGRLAGKLWTMDGTCTRAQRGSEIIVNICYTATMCYRGGVGNFWRKIKRYHLFNYSCRINNVLFLYILSSQSVDKKGILMVG